MEASIKTRGKSQHGKDSRHKHVRSEVPVESAQDRPYSFEPWTPSVYTAFKALISARLCAAIWSNVSDCDETYNYWEPMHYMMYGYGFQTWEYSPVYAIRSYAYIWLHILPLRFYTSFLQASKVIQFYFLRCLLGFLCALCEVYFYRSVCRKLGANTGRLTLCFLLFSSGMYISAAAFLPSSFTMYMTALSMACWFRTQYAAAIFFTAASAIIGWPFAGCLGIPLAYDLIVRKRKIWMFCKWSLISAVVCLIPMVRVDSGYYKHTVIAPLNIVLYNVFSEHGPNIYGVEPWTFYFLNGFLNFNFAFILALIAIPFVYTVNFLTRQQPRGSLPIWLILAPMYLWIAVFFTRPHKEERFLYPIYPFFCLAAAITLDHLQKLYSYYFNKKHSYHSYMEFSTWVSVAFCVLFAVLSVSRSMALYYGYHAPLDVYGELIHIASNPKVHTLPPDKDVNICVGKEWYRFPSHFFLPDEKWHLQFIKSNFKGQLPKPYEFGPNSTSIIPSHMNDMNLEEPTRYISLSRCHYLVDLDVPEEEPHQPRYSQNTKEWKIVATAKFLHNSGSHRLLRAFYIPFISKRYTSYIDYNILKTTRTKKLGNKL